MTDRLAIETICAMGMGPVEFVRLAAELGVGKVGMAPRRITDNPHGYPEWDLRSDPALVRATSAALAETGVAASQGEGFLIMPGTEIADTEAAMDIMAGLGAPLLNCVVIEQDRSRAGEQFALLAEMAATRGLLVSLEFMPLMWPATPAEALAFIEGTGAANARLMLDAMHWYRSGAATADIAALPAERIGYIQICDVPLASGGAMSPEAMQSYGEEARHERLCPGQGDLPLGECLAALPRDLPVGLEVPQISKARAGIAPIDAVRPCVAAARELLDSLS